MSEVTEQIILKALSTVNNPDTGKDVVSSGMITGLQVKDGHVVFAIEVDPERGPHLDPLRKDAEKTVHALEGVLTVTVALTAERPQQQQAAPNAQAQAAKPQGKQGDDLLPTVAAVVAVASGKGGVGKSTTSVNLALGLVKAGLRVGLLDADIYGPSMPRMLGITGKPVSHDGKILEPMEKYGLKVMSLGFLVDEAEPMIWRGPMVQGALEQMMRDVNWGELDVLVVDMPPGTGDVQLTMAQRVPLAGAIIVSTPQDIALIDARKGLNMFRKVDVPVLGLIENMSYFNCPKCGERSEIFSHGGAREEAKQLNIPFLGEIPLDIIIRETSDSGNPIVVSDPESDLAKTYIDIAEQIKAKIEVSIAEQQAASPRIVIN